ncbi:MAG TPA: DUF3800 domain-containing protein [Candidatus Omnitrophota bacterium]|nr:DUF3800 domain-containing protein [Candidatus Omnitrophota bacterium]
MKYYLFIDETGDHGLSFIDKNFPLFLLCGCLFREDALKDLEAKTNSFKLKYFKTTEVILHSREIRKCEGSFQILFDLKLKEAFYRDLNIVLEQPQYVIFGVGINKEEHIKKYGNQAKDPYSLSLSYIVERMIFCLDGLDKNASVDIKGEVRGKKEDEMLIAHFNSILDRGTYHITRERLQKRRMSFKFHGKRENIVGLQIADLAAYPLARHLLSPKEPYLPFKVVEKKIYCNQQGEYEGWGLKLFP